jgi:hypothetical protein
MFLPGSHRPKFFASFRTYREDLPVFVQKLGDPSDRDALDKVLVKSGYQMI